MVLGGAGTPPGGSGVVDIRIVVVLRRRLKAAVVVAQSGRRKTAGAMCHVARIGLRRAAPQPAPATAVQRTRAAAGCSNERNGFVNFDGSAIRHIRRYAISSTIRCLLS